MKTPITTTVDLVIRLQVVGDAADVEGCRGALNCLADVMSVQAEDGLWSLGQPDARTADGAESALVAGITSASVHAVLIGETPTEALQARCEQLKAIANELAAIASHAVHMPDKTTKLDERIGALVRAMEICWDPKLIVEEA